jgi:tetratricopeptide (TPR) repeat protein
MPRKYTRKALKKPDEFISFSMKAWKYVGEQAPVVATAIGAVAVVIGGIWAWTYFSDRRGMTDTETLSRALEIQHQMVMPAGITLPAGDDGIPRFNSRADKLKAAEAELSKVVQKGGRLSTDALAFRAGVRYDAGQYREAIEDLKKVAAESDDPMVKTRALEDLGYCHEALKEWDKALESFRKMPREGETRYLAMYHEARILAKSGKPKDAAKLFEEVMSRAAPALQDRASDQMALLEGK